MMKITYLALASMLCWPVMGQTAGELIADVQKSEAWIDEVKSFHLKAEMQWSRSAKQIEKRKAEMTKQFGQAPTTRDFPELLPTSTDTLEMAFTGSGLRQEVIGETNHSLRVWDGKKQMDLWKWGERVSYTIIRRPQMGESFMLFLDWGRVGKHKFWWLSKDEINRASFGFEPGEFELAGKEDYRGSECYVLRKDNDVLYVGTADHRLYGMDMRAYPRSKQDEVSRDMVAAVNKEWGLSLKNQMELGKWFEAQNEATKKKYYALSGKVSMKYLKPYIEQWMSDYREVAPGAWFPMRQGSVLRELESEDSYVSSQCDMRITLIELNPKLADSMFTMTIPQGAQVEDVDRGIRYKEDKNRTAAQWQKLENEANANKAQMEKWKKEMDGMVGKAPPVLSKQWMNSKPLTWEDLKGKVVLVDFFSEWCGPCRNDLGKLAEWHKNEKETGVIIIAIHPPGSEKEKIEKVVKEFGLGYPICIDDEETGGQAWGRLYRDFHIDGIPHAVVVDQQGKIAGHGEVGEMMQMARGLVKR